MATLSYNSGPMSIGTNYVPTPGTNKYITINGVTVGGYLTAPQQAFDIYMGLDGTVADTTTNIVTVGIIVPTYYVDPNNGFVYFDIVPQVDYKTNGTLYRDTQRYTIQVNTPAPAGMTGFTVSNNYLPVLTSIATDATPIADIGGIKKIHIIVTLASFNIPASGTAAVKVPLAL
ncbi:MAG: hypothetical protein RR444_04275 [Oscillospiraceae bacterium]